MATLLAFYDSQGLIGRCDEKCYNALLPKCQCVCGGLNHSKGLSEARENIKDLTEQELAKAHTEKTGKSDLRVLKESRQLELPI